MKKLLWTLPLLLITAGGVTLFVNSQHGPTPMGQAGAQPVSHQLWDQQLRRFVDVNGMVDYRGWKDQRGPLDQYLQLLSENPPAPNWTKAEKLAYWINAYNAFTVDIILQNYPLGSIRDLHTVPGIATIWHESFFEIGGQPTSLNQIEHGILRVAFEEPRIHFAINCASLSCPVLRAEAYFAEKLEAQLTDQARLFLSQPLRNRISPQEIELSKIFSWFSGDFTKTGSLIDFLNQYVPVKIQADAEISYMPYDWSLNEGAEVPL